MAATAPTDSIYPMPGTRPTGLHLRVTDAGADGTRRFDIAAVCSTLVGEGHQVLASSRTPSDLVVAVGRGWRDPMFRVEHHRRLVDLTAAIYEAWSVDAPLAVVVEDWMSISTGPGGGHADSTGLRWLNALIAGDVAGLEAVTGLSYAGYIGDGPSALPDGVTVVLGCRLRRPRLDDTVTTRIMGGSPLTAVAESICHVEVDTRGPVNGMIRGTAEWLKHRDGTIDSVDLERDMGPRSHWQTSN